MSFPKLVKRTAEARYDKELANERDTDERKNRIRTEMRDEIAEMRRNTLSGHKAALAALKQAEIETKKELDHDLREEKYVASVPKNYVNKKLSWRQ